MQSTSVRVDVATHEEIKRLANDLGATVGETVALAVRRLRQERMGQEFGAQLASIRLDADDEAMFDASASDVSNALGDVVRVDFGVPAPGEPRFVRPAIVVTSDDARVLTVRDRGRTRCVETAGLVDRS